MGQNMHLVARGGTSGVGEAGAGDQEARRFGMVDRSEHLPIAQQLVVVDFRRAGPLLDQRCYRRALGNCRFGQFQHAAGLFERVQMIAVIADAAHPSAAVGHSELNKTHELTFFL